MFNRHKSIYNEVGNEDWMMSMQIKIGDLFAHYEILDKLGRGGMAIVYKARDTHDDSLVALKVMHEYFMSDQRALKRFQREAMVISKLKHPNIVHLVDYGRYEDQAYVAMQYMAGRSLAESFSQPRGIVAKHTLRLLKQVAEALDYAHAKGIIHRDIKLQNILLDKNKNAFLADFGIARIIDASRLTQTGNISGTPLYMSPEQIRGQVVDFRSDIYSFGVMAYLMITGYFPFTADETLGILHQHVAEFPPKPTAINPDLPQAVDGVLLRVLMKETDDRYDKAVQFVQALEDALGSTDIESTRTIVNLDALNPKQSTIHNPEFRQPTSKVLQAIDDGGIPTQSSSSNNTGLMTLVGVVVLLLLIGGGIFVFSETNTGDDGSASELIVTQLREVFEQELTATQEAAIFATQQLSNLTQDPQQRETLPPTWTPTATHTITPSPAVTATRRPPATMNVPPILSDQQPVEAFIDNPDGAWLYIEADINSEVIRNVPLGTGVEVIGRDATSQWIEVSIRDAFEGWILSYELDLMVDLLTIPITREYEPFIQIEPFDPIDDIEDDPFEDEPFDDIEYDPFEDEPFDEDEDYFDEP